MIALDPTKPTYERIRSIQTQIRIAIQNHQVLVLKHRVSPQDLVIRNHIDEIQNLIVSMGKIQAQLLAQCRKELASASSDRKNYIIKQLYWSDMPKTIPVFKKVQSVMDDTRKIANWRCRKDGTLLRRISNKVNYSLLKVKNGPSVKDKKPLKNKIKIVVNQNESLLKYPKRMQSVLKPKSNCKTAKSSDCGKCSELDRCVCKIERSQLCPENERKTGSLPSNGIDPSKRKGSPSSCETLSDDTECAEIIPINDRSPSTSRSNSTSPKPNQKRYEPKILSRNKVKCVNSGTYLKRVIKSDSELVRTRGNSDAHKLSGLKSDSYKLYRSSRISCAENIESNWKTIEEAGQDGYLGYLGLISKTQFDALKRKRCERKRRSVAGQSSLYNDYFQPPTPKRSYGPRKAVSVPTSPNNNQVIVETATEVEDEDEKPVKTELNCVVCHLSGILEVCHSCSDSYHLKCIPNQGNGCPTCNAQSSNIKNIVGANSVSSASSMELIKRYSAPSRDNNEPVVNNQTAPGDS